MPYNITRTAMFNRFLNTEREYFINTPVFTDWYRGLFETHYGFSSDMNTVSMTAKVVEAFANNPFGVDYSMLSGAYTNTSLLDAVERRLNYATVEEINLKSIATDFRWAGGYDLIPRLVFALLLERMRADTSLSWGVDGFTPARVSEFITDNLMVNTRNGVTKVHYVRSYPHGSVLIGSKKTQFSFESDRPDFDTDWSNGILFNYLKEVADSVDYNTFVPAIQTSGFSSLLNHPILMNQRFTKLRALCLTSRDRKSVV